VRERAAWAAAAAVAVATVVALNLTTTLVGVFYDDGIYLSLAKALAEGHGYHLLYLPGTPAAVHYPFLYPLFLAALWKLAPLFPGNVAVFKAANAVLLGLGAGLLVLYLGGRTAARPWRLAVLVAAAATALPLVTVASVLFAEPLFLVLLVAACWAGDAARDAESRRSAWLLAAVAGFLAGLAALARSLGITAVVGIPLSLALARRPRAAVVTLAAASVCLAPWLVWVARHRGDVDPAILAGYGTYGALLAQAGWAALSPANVADLLRPIGAVALAPFHGWLRLFLGIPALALVAAGFGPLLRRSGALGWTLLIYVAVLVAWPVGPDRFLWAAWPFLAVAFFAGAMQMAERARSAAPAVRDAGRWAVVLTVLAVVGGYVFYQVRGYVRGDAAGLGRGISATVSQLLPWVRERTPPDAVVAGEDEALLWLYTGRRAVPSYVWRYRGRADESLGPDSLKAWLDRAHVSYVLLGSAGSDAAPTINQLLGRYPGYLHLAQMWPPPASAMAFAVDRSNPFTAPEGSGR
jgi:hypothetical protein